MLDQKGYKTTKFFCRCRSAFKLIEIDDKFKFLKAGQIVVDLGAAPGSWTQVLVKRTNSDGFSKCKF
jgi:23S rRNA (uridine2552-2'-O)-methyltransferase